MKRNNMIDYILDFTVIYDNVVENELQFIKGNMPKQVDYYLEVIDCRNDKVLINEEWLLERWRIKDSLLDKYFLLY